jgi:N-sulfoglucosamine sulfohydrolase
VSTQPNVLLIVQEDVSPRFGCYGDDVARTPNLDRLADDGRVYDNAFCTAGVCAPSRASLLTGCAPPTIGAHHMRTGHPSDGYGDAGGGGELPTPYEAVPPHYVRAFTERLRAAGYYCTLDSKTDYQFGEPFTMWDHHGEGAGWWDECRDPDQPFFAMMTNGVTHESGMWPPDVPDRDRPDDPPDTDPDEVEVPPYIPDTPETRLALARHYDNLERSDAWVGDLLDRLAADGHAEDTLVILTADHGEGLPRCKRWPYDSGTNVPLLVRWPGAVDAGGQTDRLVSLVDVAPTVLSLAGIDVPSHVEGRPFLGPSATDRDYVFATRDRYGESYDMVRSVRDGRYRYVRHYEPDQPYVQWVPYRNVHPAMAELLRRDAANELTDAQARWMQDTRPVEELYDLHRDPHELENLADDPGHAETLDRLRSALDDWRDRVGDRRAGAEAESEMVRRVWPDGEQPTTATPTFVPNASGNRGRRATPEGDHLEGPATLSLYCATQGASIGYAIDQDHPSHWHLYTGAIDLPASEEITLRTKAIRYGYAESDVHEATFRVE